MASNVDVASLFSVTGKVVLVTGGGRGIGKMIATAFARNGAKTVFITSRTTADCVATANELNKLTGKQTCIAIGADLQKYEEVVRLVKEISAKEKKLHVLVNNAGAAWGADIDEHPDAAFTKVLTLNLQRVFTLTQLTLPLLRAAVADSKDGATFRDPARIINIGSVEGLSVPAHETYAYSASKAGLHHLSRHLAGRLGEEGITSNTIACGMFPTKMMKTTIDAVGEALEASVPLHRMGTPEDIAGAVLFISSKAGAYLNGATITLDGGMLVSMSRSKL